MTRHVKLNHAAIRRVLESTEMHRLVQAAAERVADEVRAQGITVGDKDGGTSEYALPVTVEVTTTDRAHATVLLAHPAGIAVQAKHGALSKATAAVGLEIHGGQS